MRNIVLGVVAALALTWPSQARERARTEWSETAVDDLHFVRAALRENHPGPVDPSNPAFHDWFVRGFNLSLAMAEKARSYAGYYFAIQHYLVGFQDSHLGALGDDRMGEDVELRRRWPGFIIDLEQGQFRVEQSELGGPAVGAVLVGCDGRSVKQLADEIIKPFLPLWSLRGARFQNAPFLLVDEGNPFVHRPAVCIFEGSGKRQKIRLNWSPIANVRLAPMIKVAHREIDATTGIRPFGSHGWWITLASFNANSDADAQPLLDVIDRVSANPAIYSNADTLVLDVRGNTGGNSEFGKRIAAAIWGRAFVDSVPTSTAVDWRVSALNLRQLERSNLPSLEKRFGKDDPQTRAYVHFVDAFTAALKRGDVYYRETLPPATARAPALPVRAKVYLVTDGWCHSACLDFVDLVLAAPGTVQVGAETSADAVYIDNTAVLMPSGEGFLGWSMKVHRERPRGNNQSYMPKHTWTGSMNDTKGLEQWIAGLAQSRD
jgi:hypothetical protein